ncbi:hypothetical protein PENFLA_c002G09160 [Penicillium flavigenum]|uniref:DUF6604 domain-containing protein n=1 Tax=Penicillium flavigenum TaxID=254877 RepID=A0A1V6TYZ3_9EURO|nr:hypothetical protein PENFLA_c002G09160 [Penicillium flavigenum]
MNNPSNRDNEQSPNHEAGGGNTNLDMFVNKFSVLAVEEPQEPQQGQRKSPELKNVVKVELVNNDEDEATDSHCRLILFKAYCLFQDLYKMRAFISYTWSEYRDKKIDLMNAAVMTDSALQLRVSLLV